MRQNWFLAEIFSLWSTLEGKLPGFKDLNIFLHVMYCKGAMYFLLKVFMSNSGAASTCAYGLWGGKDKHTLSSNHLFSAQMQLEII